ncbi:MAG: hypothetical protein LBB84_03510, partial [Tannerellaceae bacterium]|nr:hypothetical protein [Tannerellaceae bacterium]
APLVAKETRHIPSLIPLPSVETDGNVWGIGLKPMKAFVFILSPGFSPILPTLPLVLTNEREG